MNLPDCAFGPSVGPSQVVTCAVDAAISALAAASASPPAWAVMTGAATVTGSAPADTLSSCIRLPALSTVPAVKPARLKKLRRVHFAIVDLLSLNSFLRRECALPTTRGIRGQTYGHDQG